MDAFETSLKRAFAEAPEPVDDDFVFAVTGAVARHEKTQQARGVLEAVGMAAGATAVLYGVAQFALGLAPDLMASAGLQLARSHGTLLNLSSFSLSSVSLSAGLTQVLLALGALGGGAVVYRANQQ